LSAKRPEAPKYDVHRIAGDDAKFELLKDLSDAFRIFVFSNCPLSCIIPLLFQEEAEVFVSAMEENQL
jgi:hypothetical protein